MNERREIFVTQIKELNVEKLQQHLEIEHTSKKQIEQVCLDISPAFISGVNNNFPDAEITFDKFHTVKIVNEAMDAVRKLVRFKFTILKGHNIHF